MCPEHPSKQCTRTTNMTIECTSSFISSTDIGHTLRTYIQLSFVQLPSRSKKREENEKEIIELTEWETYVGRLKIN